MTYRVLEIAELSWLSIEERVQRLIGNCIRMDSLCEIKEPIKDSFPRRA